MMRLNQLSLLLMLLLVLPIFQVRGSNSDIKIGIVHNEQDSKAAERLTRILKMSGLNVTTYSPADFKEALKNEEIIFLLGGHKAYQGMGNISGVYLPPGNKTTLEKVKGSYVISVWEGNREVITLAGSTRKETLEAVDAFFLWVLEITRLANLAGYPVQFSKNSRAVYELETFSYDNVTGRYSTRTLGQYDMSVLNYFNKDNATYFNVSIRRQEMILGVNWTIFTWQLVDGLGRVSGCRVSIFMDGKLNSTSTCPSKLTRQGSVYVLVKTGPYDWTLASGKKIKVIELDKYLYDMKWRVIGVKVIDFVNPSIIPFGGLVARGTLVYNGKEWVHQEYLELYSFRR